MRNTPQARHAGEQLNPANHRCGGYFPPLCDRGAPVEQPGAEDNTHAGGQPVRSGECRGPTETGKRGTIFLGDADRHAAQTVSPYPARDWPLLGVAAARQL